jgi:hypothetical protein
MTEMQRRQDGDEREHREAVTTVVKFASDLRPSVPAVGVSPLAVAILGQVCSLGHRPVGVPAPLSAARTNEARSNEERTSQAWTNAARINNYIGITSAMGEGLAASSTYGQRISAVRTQVAQLDKAKGGDARGIPPRGRPV